MTEGIRNLVKATDMAIEGAEQELHETEQQWKHRRGTSELSNSWIMGKLLRLAVIIIANQIIIMRNLNAQNK